MQELVHRDGESHRLERESREEELYRILMDAIPLSVLLIDNQLRVVLTNRNFLEKIQQPAGQVIGHRLAEVFPQVILEEIGLEQQIHKVFRENQATPGQRFTYRAPSHLRRSYYYRILPVPGQAGVENVMLLMEEITEQIRLDEEMRRMERLLASIVESARDIVLSTDMEGKILTWNLAAERLSWVSREEAVGRCFVKCCVADTEKEETFISSLRSQEDDARMVEWDFITGDKRLIPVSWIFSPMKDGFNRKVGMVAVGRDLTEHRKLEMQLMQSQKLAALGVMASGIAHELRNPLAISSSAAQFLLRDDLTSEFRKKCLDQVCAGILRASIIIEDLLQLAHPSTQFQPEPIDIAEILHEALSLISPPEELYRVELNLPDSPGPILVLGIASLLEQVFVNLFQNALNAMPHGGSLKIAVEKVETGIEVRVIDTGHGMARSELDKIFDPFYTTSPVGEGTGLGLSICHSIVIQHHGAIQVQSLEGRGSTFTVRLPTV